MLIGGDKLARSRIPELGAVIGACCEDSSTVRAKHRRVNRPLMNERGDEFAGGCIPELGSFVPTCRQDPGTIRTKRCFEDRILMVKGGDKLRQRLSTMKD